MKRTGKRRKTTRGAGPRKTAKRLVSAANIDATDYDLLRRCMTEQGKLLPGRVTGASARVQRQLKRAVRRARVMGLVP
jgi:small subunit ribosomal protein S18